MNPSEFAAKWGGSTRTERAASQEHFIDLCRMLEVKTPNEADPYGDWYAFEKGAEKTTGDDGFADVWKRSHFAWEYKGKRKDLGAAYQQLLQYREALENPPLLVVCDLDRFEVHTNYTDTTKVVHAFTLNDLADSPQEPLRVLRAVVSDPNALRPTKTREELTEEAAAQFASLAGSLAAAGHEPQRVAHFLNKLLFCMFAEDSSLLPGGLIRRLADGTRDDPAAFTTGLADLFGKMSAHGGLFGPERIQWFNGGLFDGADVVLLNATQIAVVRKASELDWSQVEPAIFGTLFERGLDPDKRSQLGAHYTDRQSITTLVDAVISEPLHREFEAVQVRVGELLATGRRVTKATRPENDPIAVYRSLLERIRTFRVLDPACGSGNFLYIALQCLKDLEREVILWGSLALRIPMEFPQVGPQALHGIETNVYAAELARIVIWIGEIQWMLNHGFAYLRDPVLRPLDAIECRDAVLDLADPTRPVEAAWPSVDAIVGNPPFVGGKLMRSYLGDDYVDALFRVYRGRVPAEADFVCYWHEKARAMVADGGVKRVGLLATQGIRGGANRRVLERIKETGDLFMARSDDPWILDGAAVHVSFVAFDDGSETRRTLDGRAVAAINANLTAGLDVTAARRLKENLGISFMGDTKGGPFDIPAWLAHKMLEAPNPDGRHNGVVVRPWVNGLDITRRPRGMWIIDFGDSMPIEEAALYEAPFEYVRKFVQPIRASNRRAIYAERWWLHMEPRSGMRRALGGLRRYIGTCAVSKHRLFAWIDATTLSDHAIMVFARDDDYFFGVLHSRPHELWARRMGTQLREQESGFRYTPTTTFETFPLPRSTEDQVSAIGSAARALDTFRQGWLNPDSVDPAILKGRTLTELYNQRPTWLAQAHERLDRAVLAAYGWPLDASDDDIVAALLALNLQREPAN